MYCEVSYLYIGLLTQLLYLTYAGFLNNKPLYKRSNWSQEDYKVTLELLLKWIDSDAS